MRLFRKNIIWIPVGLLIIVAASRFFYWQPYQHAHGHSGGSFGPFSEPFYKNILVVKFKVDGETYLYKNALGNPFKVIMLPSTDVVSEIGRRILNDKEFYIYPYKSAFGTFDGEIYVKPTAKKGKPHLIKMNQIESLELDLWLLDCTSSCITRTTNYSLVESITYPITK